MLSAPDTFKTVPYSFPYFSLQAISSNFWLEAHIILSTRICNGMKILTVLGTIMGCCRLDKYDFTSNSRTVIRYYLSA